MKGLKTGGRKRGTPNKVNSLVSDLLQANNMNLVQEAVNIYKVGDEEFKLKVLTLLFPYVYPKRAEIPVEDEELDITPLTLEDKKRLFIQATEELAELKAEIDKEDG